MVRALPNWICSSVAFSQSTFAAFVAFGVGLNHAAVGVRRAAVTAACCWNSAFRMTTSATSPMPPKAI